MPSLSNEMALSFHFTDEPSFVKARPGVICVDSQNDFVIFYDLGTPKVIHQQDVSALISRVWPLIKSGVLLQDLFLDCDKTKSQLSQFLDKAIENNLLTIEKTDFKELPEVSNLTLLLSKTNGAARQTHRILKEKNLLLFAKKEDFITLKRKLSDFGFDANKIFLCEEWGLATDFKNSLAVVVAEQTETPAEKERLRLLNSRLILEGYPWVLVQLDQFGGAVGPYFSRESNVCYECFNIHRASSLQELSFMETVNKRMGETKISREPFPFKSIVFSWASIEIYKLVTGLGAARIADGQFQVDGLNHRTQLFPVYSVKSCNLCQEGLDHDFT